MLVTEYWDHKIGTWDEVESSTECYLVNIAPPPGEVKGRESKTVHYILHTN
jgi:hypothetical protein